MYWLNSNFIIQNLTKLNIMKKIYNNVPRRRKCMKLSPNHARGYYLAGTMLHQVLRNLTNKIGKK